MNRNAIGTPRQTPSPESSTCPLWCHRHDGYDQGHRDEVLIHYGRRRRAAGYAVQLRRDDTVRTGRPGPVRVELDGQEITRQQAGALARLLDKATDGTLS